MNKVILIGNLTRDVEVKNTQSGKQVATVGIATSRKYKTESGEVKEAVQFHNLVVWGKGAETFAKYLSKGKKVMVEGELNHRSWDKEDGTKGYVTEINVREFEFLTPKGSGVPGPTDPQGMDAVKERMENVKRPAGTEDPNEEIRVEDIPF